MGAGTGNYEPTEGFVVAVEPSWAMIAQRPPDVSGAVRAVSERLSFSNGSFDVALATFTLHHWLDLAGGLAELHRVADRQVIVMSDPVIGRNFWLAEYFPEMFDLESEQRAPTVATVAVHFSHVDVEVLEVPSTCSDGFCGAYWSRPEADLDARVRMGISSLAQLSPGAIRRGVQRLGEDLGSGRWDTCHGRLRTLEAYDLGYRLLTCS
ncbi:MAG: methyltransferase domain-containing protein [Acidimicrobiales bacterium]|nr:methyltransferase domain-containing protein [Acidimicrobiales bacterium]